MKKIHLIISIFISLFLFAQAANAVDPGPKPPVGQECSSYGEWRGTCKDPRERQNCTPTQGGVMDVYQCCKNDADPAVCNQPSQNEKPVWKYRYPECNYACRDNSQPVTIPKINLCSNIKVSSRFNNETLGSIYEDSGNFTISLTVPDEGFYTVQESISGYKTIIPVKGQNQVINYEIDVQKILKNQSVLAERPSSGELIKMFDPEFKHTVSVYREGTGGEYCIFDYFVIPAHTELEQQDEDKDIDTAFRFCKLQVTSERNEEGLTLTDKTPVIIKGAQVPIQLNKFAYPFLEPVYKLRVIWPSGREQLFTEVRKNLNENINGNFADFTYNTRQNFIPTEVEGCSTDEEKLKCYRVSLLVENTKDPRPGIFVDAKCEDAFFSIGVNESGVNEGGNSTDNKPLPPPEIKDVCKSVSSEIKDDCEDCVGTGKAYTALGCIPTDLPTFLKDYLFTIGLGFAGGIAFLLMLWGGFTILISQGDAHKIQEGREIIVSAGVGLLFIIFSIVILQIIGKDILHLPFIGGE